MNSFARWCWGTVRPLWPLLNTRCPNSTGAHRYIRTHSIPSPKVVDRWNEKRVMFGMYDNIGILGDFKVHPRVLIRGPSWLRGWKGNELQRCLRKRRMVGPRMFEHDKHLLDKRVKYLWRAFNRVGKMR